MKLATGLPKSIIAKYGISKEAWRVYRNQKKKPKKNSSSKRSLTKVVRRRRRASPKKRSRRKDKRVPLLPVGGFAVPLAFGSPFNGTWASPVQAIQEGNLEKAIQSTVYNLAGVRVPMQNTGYRSVVQFDWKEALNPFNFEAAGAIKGAVWGALASKFMTKLGVNRNIAKIPFVGKHIKL